MGCRFSQLASSSVLFSSLNKMTRSSPVLLKKKYWDIAHVAVNSYLHGITLEDMPSSTFSATILFSVNLSVASK